MLSALGLALLGFLLGVRHAVDPDHVVAVTAIATGQRSIRRATFVGALWGIGHTVTILLVGGAIILFRIAIPPRLGLAFEFAVGLILIVLGIVNLISKPEEMRSPSGARPLVVGMVHGLAGSAAVALIVPTYPPSPKSSDTVGDFIDGRMAITAPPEANSCRASTRCSGSATQPAVPVVGERQTWMKMQEPACALRSVG